MYSLQKSKLQVEKKEAIKTSLEKSKVLILFLKVAKIAAAKIWEER